MDIKYCPGCGVKLGKEDDYCFNCGMEFDPGPSGIIFNESFRIDEKDADKAIEEKNQGGITRRAIPELVIGAIFIPIIGVLAFSYLFFDDDPDDVVEDVLECMEDPLCEDGDKLVHSESPVGDFDDIENEIIYIMEFFIPPLTFDINIHENRIIEQEDTQAIVFTEFSHSSNEIHDMVVYLREEDNEWKVWDVEPADGST